MKDLKRFEIDKQALFCRELASRLADDILKATVSYGYMEGYTQLLADIKRLRRELMELAHMIY